eukprot:6182988-Pleurochrysis_carterae.AAC.1
MARGACAASAELFCAKREKQWIKNVTEKPTERNDRNSHASWSRLDSIMRQHGPRRVRLRTFKAYRAHLAKYPVLPRLERGRPEAVHLLDERGGRRGSRGRRGAAVADDRVARRRQKCMHRTKAETQQLHVREAAEVCMQPGRRDLRR